jgi:hypothetical protein
MPLCLAEVSEQIHISCGSGDCMVVLAKLSAELHLLEDEEVPQQ